jgi:DNA-binding YbaB/EbfC family protein
MSQPFDFGALGALGGLGGLSGLLGNFQQRVEAMKQRARETRVEGVAAGGLVRVCMAGDMSVESVRIDPKAMEDRELLEDLVRVAVSEAAEKARAEIARGMSELTGGLPIPPGLLGF